MRRRRALSQHHLTVAVRYPEGVEGTHDLEPSRFPTMADRAMRVVRASHEGVAAARFGADQPTCRTRPRPPKMGVEPIGYQEPRREQLM